MSITHNLAHINALLPQGVRLLAVSKFHPVESLLEAYQAGQRAFGESRAQELVAKQKALPADIEWHFIGTLQSNKVKDIAPFVHLVHSIDSLKLLQEVNKQAAKCHRVISVLLEVHIAQEESKQGFSPEECRHLLENPELEELKNIAICGLMGMATNIDKMEVVRQEFDALHLIFEEFKRDFFANAPHFCELSMGMSHDFEAAIQSGSTLVRMGTALFGEREY